MLPTLPLNTATDEARIAAALRAAGATVMARYGAALRRAAVAEWEVRLRVPDGSGAWRLVVSSPTGAQPGPNLWNSLCNALVVLSLHVSGQYDKPVHKCKHGCIPFCDPSKCESLVTGWEGLLPMR